MEEWKHLTKVAVLAIHEEVLLAHGGAVGIRDEGLLESALAAPQASMFGDPIFKDAIEISAAYLFYICKNHPFLDGNKRTALAAALVFLHENDALHRCNMPLPVDAWESLVVSVAAGQLKHEELTARLRTLVRNSPS